MKRCPSCNRTYTDLSLNFCLEDGSPLTVDVVPRWAGPVNRAPRQRSTSAPPPTEIFRPDSRTRQAPHWSPPLQAGPRKKSSAIWWVLGGIVVVGIIGIGLVIMLLALSKIGANENSSNDNSNMRIVNRNSSTNTNITPDNNNQLATPTPPAGQTDDFAVERWRTGTFQFGDIWYADDEYHMRAKDKMYLVMYAPGTDYNTENARVRVTARSVDGVSPASGYGLIVHGEKSPDNALEDYALLVYSGSEPQYQIVMHKDGVQKTLVSWTKSSVIRSGTNPNQLEIRSKGDELSFYINGRYLTRVTNTENNKRGVAGLYTSETGEVAFDDLEITR